jgi:putative protein-disulfide isomerase
MLDLVYFADPMCSWCYGFGPQLTRVLKHETRAQPVTLDLVMGGLRAYNTVVMDEASKEVVRAHWQQVGERTGLGFDDAAMRAEGFIYDTEPACRAVVTARHLNAQMALALHHAIQDAFYRDGRDVTKTPVLADIARACGLHGAAFDEAFNSTAMKEATRDDFALTQRAGVNGFPTLCVDAAGKLLLITAGFAPAEAIEAGLARLAG